MPDIIFVTGGHGFIGSRVVDRLIEEGYAVRCLVRSTSDTARIDHLDWERVIGDVRDKASMADAVQGCRAILHLASPSAWRDITSPHMRDIVEGGTRNVLELAAVEGECRVVFCSTVIAINGSETPEVMNEDSPFGLGDNPELVYAHAKHRAETICRDAAAQGQDVVIVNPAETYGPADDALITAGNLIDFAKSWPVLISHGGTGVVHVDDVALGMVRAMERGEAGERYLLSGDNLTIRELAGITLELLGQNKPIVAVPTGLLRWIARLAIRLNLPMPFEPHVIPYATRYFFMDNTKARTQLGVEFKSAREVLAPTLAWLKAAGKI